MRLAGLTLAGVLGLTFCPTFAQEPARDPCANFTFKGLRLGMTLDEVRAAKKTVKKCGMLCPDEAKALLPEGDRFFAYDDRVKDTSVVRLDGDGKVNGVWILLNNPNIIGHEKEVDIGALIDKITEKIGEPVQPRLASDKVELSTAFRKEEVPQYSTVWINSACDVSVGLREMIPPESLKLSELSPNLADPTFYAKHREVFLLLLRSSDVSKNAADAKKKAEKLLD